MYMYSVEDKWRQPRMMFASLEDAKANQQPSEFIVEYTFSLEDSETIVSPPSLDLDGGEE